MLSFSRYMKVSYMWMVGGISTVKIRDWKVECLCYLEIFMNFGVKLFLLFQNSYIKVHSSLPGTCNLSIKATSGMCHFLFQLCNCFITLSFASIMLRSCYL